MKRFNTAMAILNERLPQGQKLSIQTGTWSRVYDALKMWSKNHGWLFPWACVQGLYTPRNPEAISKHFLLFQVAPRWDQSPYPRRHFGIKNISIPDWHKGNDMRQLLGTEYEAGKQAMEEYYSKPYPPLTYRTLAVFWCPPLPAVTQVFDLSRGFVNEFYHEPNWMQVTIDDVLKGDPSSKLVKRRPLLAENSLMLRVA